jgi:hypothetical protein
MLLVHLIDHILGPSQILGSAESPPRRSASMRRCLSSEAEQTRRPVCRWRGLCVDFFGVGTGVGIGAGRRGGRRVGICITSLERNVPSENHFIIRFVISIPPFLLPFSLPLTTRTGGGGTCGVECRVSSCLGVRALRLYTRTWLVQYEHGR